MTFRSTYACCKNLAVLTATALLTVTFSGSLLAQITSDTRGRMVPVMVQEPSSQEFQQDREAIHALGERGDLSTFVTAANLTSDKWLLKDKLSYYCILSEICGDLTSDDFGVLKLSEQEKDKEEYVMKALDHDDALPLGMKAYFVGQLMYVPSHGLAGVTGQKWSLLRTRRTKLLLDTWQELRGRTIPNFKLVPVFPKLPPLQYIYHDTVLDGNVDPNDITDAKERAKYVAATKKYISDRQLVSAQEDVNRVISTFQPRAEEHIIAFYSSAPYNTDELEKSLDESQIAPVVREEILAAVKENIKRNTAAGK